MIRENKITQSLENLVIGKQVTISKPVHQPFPLVKDLKKENILLEKFMNIRMKIVRELQMLNSEKRKEFFQWTMTL